MLTDARAKSSLMHKTDAMMIAGTIINRFGKYLNIAQHQSFLIAAINKFNEPKIKMPSNNKFFITFDLTQWSPHVMIKAFE